MAKYDFRDGGQFVQSKCPYCALRLKAVFETSRTVQKSTQMDIEGIGEKPKIKTNKDVLKYMCVHCFKAWTPEELKIEYSYGFDRKIERDWVKR